MSFPLVYIRCFKVSYLPWSYSPDSIINYLLRAVIVYIQNSHHPIFPCNSLFHLVCFSFLFTFLWYDIQQLQLIILLERVFISAIIVFALMPGLINVIRSTLILFQLQLSSLTLQCLKFHFYSFFLQQLCDFGFARVMSANTVVLRSIKGILFLPLNAI